MKPVPALRRTLWTLAALALAAGLALAALRVARSMRRGRGAAFSLSEPLSPSSQKAALDFLSGWDRGRYEGPSAEQAGEALLRCPGPAAWLPGPRGRTAAVTLAEDGRPAARLALHLASGGRAEFPFVVPAGAVLSFHTGVRAEGGGKFEMTAELLVAGQPPVVLDQRREVLLRSPSGRGGEPVEAGWRRVEADLSPWSGRPATLRLAAAFQPAPNESSSSTAHAFWGSPTVWEADKTLLPLKSARRAPAWSADPQNLVWVVLETFPAPSDPSVTHGDFPGLDLLSSEGVEFQLVYTNRTDAEGGLRRLLEGRAEGPPEGPRGEGGREGRALPEILRAAGYRTALFGAPGADPGAWARMGFETARGAPPPGPGGEAALREAARWLAANGGRGPYFLMVFVRAPDAGEDPSPRCWLRAARLSPAAVFRSRRWRALAQAVQMDGAMGRLWEQMIRWGRDGRAVLAAASLRGASFRAEPLRRLSDGRLFRRPLSEPGWGLREEEVRVLWLMRHARLGAGRKVTSPAQLLDAAPTVLELLGLSPDREMEGMSFMQKDAHNARTTQGARFLIEGAGGDALVLDGHYKYVRRAGPRLVSAGGVAARTDFEPEELFDLWMDPGERRNLALRRRDLLARARRAVNEHRPERTAVKLLFRGFAPEPARGFVICPGGDLWNVTLSSGVLHRAGANQVTFETAPGGAAISFETWPPPASYSLSVRAPGVVPARAFLVSHLGLPLVEAEKRTEWYDGNKFPWMDGFPPSLPDGQAPRGGPVVYMGRVPVREPAP